MRTRKLVIGLVLVCLMLFALTGVASAWFETYADSSVRGKTGWVRITACNVRLTDLFQPGDTQMGIIKVHNTGPCPVKIVRVEIRNKPWFLAVYVEGPLNLIIRPGEMRAFRMYVRMPSGYTKPQSQDITYKVRFYALNTPTRWSTPPQK